MLRAAIIFRWVYGGHPIRLTFVAAPDPAFRPARWYADGFGRTVVVEEYAKLAIGVAELSARSVARRL